MLGEEKLGGLTARELARKVRILRQSERRQAALVDAQIRLLDVMKRQLVQQERIIMDLREENKELKQRGVALRMGRDLGLTRFEQREQRQTGR